MTKEAEKDLIDLLKTFQSDQSLTIESLTREYLRRQGLIWQGYKEIEAQVEIEKYLIDNGLIKDSGKTTKLFNVDKKIKTL